MKLIFFHLFILFFSSPSYSSTRIQEYEGEAFSEGKLVYREKHRVEFQSEKLVKSETLYLNPEGERIGKLESDYSKSINLPHYLMEDISHKNKHGVRYQGDQIYMFTQEKKESEKTKLINPKISEDELWVAGQGLHYYLVHHLQEVVKKKELKLKFLIPGRLEVYDFYLKVIRQEKDQVEMEVLLDNWFLKLFTPKLTMIYDLKNKNLLSYVGPSNLQGPDNKIMKVKIFYKGY